MILSICQFVISDDNDDDDEFFSLSLFRQSVASSTPPGCSHPSTSSPNPVGSSPPPCAPTSPIPQPQPIVSILEVFIAVVAFSPTLPIDELCHSATQITSMMSDNQLLELERNINTKHPASPLTHHARHKNYHNNQDHSSPE